MSNELTNSQLKILLVEDMPVQAARFISVLEGDGFDVNWVDTGQAGLDSVEEVQYDLVLLDVELPDINGFDICRKLKSHPDDTIRNTHVIMLTTHDRAEEVLQGLDLGAIDYIPKDSFAEAVLLATIKHMNQEGQFSRE